MGCKHEDIRACDIKINDPLRPDRDRWEMILRQYMEDGHLPKHFYDLGMAAHDNGSRVTFELVDTWEACQRTGLRMSAHLHAPFSGAWEEISEYAEIPTTVIWMESIHMWEERRKTELILRGWREDLGYPEPPERIRP